MRLGSSDSVLCVASTSIWEATLDRKSEPINSASTRKKQKIGFHPKEAKDIIVSRMRNNNTEIQTMARRTRTRPCTTSEKQYRRTRHPSPSPVQRTSSKRGLAESEDASRRRDMKRSAFSKRRVTFELDENRRVKTHTRRIQNRLELEEEDIELLWWSQTALDEIMEREQNVFEVMSTCCTSYVETVLRVWGVCDAAQSSSSGDTSSKQAAHAVLAADKADLERIACAPARGMENDVVIAVVPGYREKAIKSVIETQLAMAKANHKIRTSTMRRRYRNHSKAASMFAKSIADGDAQVAADIHQ